MPRKKRVVLVEPAIPLPDRVTVRVYEHTFTSLLALFDAPTWRGRFFGSEAELTVDPATGALQCGGRLIQDFATLQVLICVEGPRSPKGGELRFSIADIRRAMQALAVRNYFRDRTGQGKE